MPIIVAYLDVLGFSSYAENDLAGAIGVLYHQKWLLEQKLLDGAHHPAASYGDPKLARVAEAHLVDSFVHFLTGSDSTFVVSEEPDKFLRQLSNLLIESLELVGHAYSDADNPQQPESVQITDLHSGSTSVEHWFPPLWSGGLATGAVHSFRITGIENRRQNTTPNLAGNAIVNAVRAADAGPGPRLFCKLGFEKNFSDEIRPFFRRINGFMSELLWPAFAYLDGNDPTVEINHFQDLWRPAVALWRSKRKHRAFKHYDEFLKLLVRSALCWADSVGHGEEVRRLARYRIKKDIGDDLNLCQQFVWWSLLRERFHSP